MVAQLRKDDPKLADDLARMLAAHVDAGSEFLADPTVDPANIPFEKRTIGPFKVLRRLGEGGFGEVYLAEQASPIRRQVALKLIKPGMDSGQILARFDAERQALAIMDHTNIARVYDAGTDERGRPWFAMELVTGEPINIYADKHRLDVRKRIELMIPVCRAVHHAHQKGVIHRDLKPGNVLVSEVDGAAVPKVIDFGVAKALGRPLTDKTLFTEMRSLVGTPEYMSPEQADLDGGRDIDTRSDVYSLGVLLYELLVGATPFDARDLRSRAFNEIQRIIREVDPPTPSTRFGSLETRGNAAANRGIEPAKLSTSLRGELDWITMKCLEKDRARRYDSAAMLAEELARYLDNKPVNAGPVSTGYRLQKFVRRHRVGTTIAAIATVATIIAASGIVWGLIEARRERDLAITARAAADRSRLAAESARESETQARAIEQQNSTFLREMFESIDPSEALGKDVTVREVLDAATARINANPPTNPAVESALRATFGRTYTSLGVFDAARRQLERAIELKDTSPETRRSLIGVLAEQGNHADALAMAKQAVDESTKSSGADSLDTLGFQNALANVLVKQDKRPEAEAVLNDIIARAKTQITRTTQPESMQDMLVEAISSLSSLQIGDGRFEEAERMLLEALAIARSQNTKETPTSIGIQSNLGDLYRNVGRFDDAVTMLRPARDAAIRVFGPEHTSTLTVTNNLALALMTIGKLDESKAMFDQLVAVRARLQGEDHPRTLLARSNRGLVLQQQQKFDEAEKEFKDIAARYLRVLGPDHQDTIIAENNYATILIRQNRLDEAEPIMQRLLDRVIATQGEHTLASTSISLRLASIKFFKGNAKEAEPLYARAFAGAQAMGIADVQAGFALGYGLCLAEVGKAKEAVEMLTRADAAFSKMPNPDLIGSGKLSAAMVKLHTQLGNPDEAAKWSARLPASQPTTMP